jgi:hypothetical protein
VRQDVGRARPGRSPRRHRTRPVGSTQIVKAIVGEMRASAYSETVGASSKMPVGLRMQGWPVGVPSGQVLLLDA